MMLSPFGRRAFLGLVASLCLIPAVSAQEQGEGGMDEPSADASNAEEINLAARPVLYLQSNALWDDNFITMKESFAALSAEMSRLGLMATGSPIASYLDTDDAGFTFQAMLLIAGQPPAGRSPSDPRMKFGLSPAGKALRFAHTGAFDELDSLYEAITGYLDEKRLTMRTPYLEEYVSPLADSADPAFRMNIYILLDESKPPPPEDAAPATPVPIDPAPGAPKPATPVPQPAPDAG